MVAAEKETELPVTEEMPNLRFSAVIRYVRGSISNRQFVTIAKKPFVKLTSVEFPSVSQSQLGDVCACSYASIQNWEKGQGLPQLTPYVKLLRYINKFVRITTDEMNQFLFDLDIGEVAPTPQAEAIEVEDLVARVRKLKPRGAALVAIAAAEIFAGNAMENDRSEELISIGGELERQRFRLLLAESLNKKGVKPSDLENQGIPREVLNSVLQGFDAKYARHQLEKLAQFCCYVRAWDEDDVWLDRKKTYADVDELLAALRLPISARADS